MSIKNLVIGLALLALAGCGCGDSGPESPDSSSPSFTVDLEVPPCEFPCRPQQNQECKIDVVFAIDDSEFMNRPFGMTAGLPQVPQGDSRSRSVVAQRIFADTQARLLQKINEAKQAGAIPMDVEIDLAFAVVRYEDFGGTTVPYQGQDGTIDANARPYMLQMPLLRELHPQFATRFATALAEATLGNGNPTVTPGAPPFQDPQTAIEMLHQVATGAGIDGNALNGTVDNGAPCSPTAKGTVPGTFVDVPATTYAANGQDPQDATRPLYLVQDENGAGDASCIASGNQGGVGFRPDSLRWVIFASDIATVAPFRDDGGAPADPASNADAATVSTTEGSVPARAFDGVTGRYGAAGAIPPAPPVLTGMHAPLYAAGVEQAVNELVNAGIEVMALGAGGAQPGQTKPNVPVANDPDPNREPAIISPALPDFTPFTMESAISILTGSEVIDETVPANPGPFPAVFNLGTVGVVDLLNQDPLVPTMSATIVNDDLINALVERIAARIATKEPTQEPGDCPQLPEITATVTMTLNEAEADGTANYLRQTPVPTSVTFTIPSYYRDTVTNEIFTVDAGGNRVPLASVPASVRMELGDAFYSLRDSTLLLTNNPLPIDMLSFTVSAVELSVTNNTPENAARVEQLRAKLPAFASSGQVTIQAFRLPPANTNQRNAVLLPGASSGYCMIFQETTPQFGPFAEERVGATCPAP